jgi:hypothetical protein
MLFSQTCRIALICAMAGTGPYDPAAIISAEELLNALDAQQKLLNGIMVNVEVQGYSALCGDKSHRGIFGPSSDDPKPEQLRARLTCSILKCGRKYRIEERALDAAMPDGAANSNATNLTNHNGVRVYACDGTNYITVNRGETGNESCLISLTAVDQRPSPGAMDICSWWVFGQDLRNSFADYLRDRRARIQSARLLEDGSTQFVFLPRSDNSQTEFIYRAKRHGPHIQLTEVEMRVYRHERPTYSDNDLRLSFGISFGPINWEVGEFMPRTATLLWRFVADDPEESTWAITRVFVRSAIRADLNEHSFHPAPSPGAMVIDTRYRLTYQLGGHLLTVDGRPVRTATPLEGDVGERLEWWLENGEFAPVPDAVTRQFSGERCVEHEGEAR